MNWKKLLKIATFLLLLALIFFWLRSNFWQVKKVDCQFNQLNCSQEITQKISELCLGKNLVFLSRQRLADKIKENLPQVDEVKIKKRIPDRILFELTSRKPVVALAVELSSEMEATASGKPQFSLTGIYYFVDEQGVVVKKMEESQNLPLILFKNDPQFKNGQKINQGEVLKVIEIILGVKLRLLEPEVSRIINAQEIEVWLKDGVLTLFNGEKDIGVQLDSLQFIYSRSKIEGKQIKKIDLRFDKPVIAQ